MNMRIFEDTAVYYLDGLESGIFEIGEAFTGLSDSHVWVRPAPGLLSIGEIAAHVAYWEAIRFASDGITVHVASEGIGETYDLSKCRVTSPLIDNQFRYYSTNVDLLPTPEKAALTAEQVHSELVRVHRESIADLTSRNSDLDTDVPGWPPGNTYREFLKYAVFHIAYHTGQIYSVRHLLGEVTPDN